MNNANVTLCEAKDIAEIINNLTDAEKAQAFALLKGMLIGKELAESSAEKSA